MREIEIERERVCLFVCFKELITSLIKISCRTSKYRLVFQAIKKEQTTKIFNEEGIKICKSNF